MSETELLPYTEEELAEVTAAIEHEIRTCGSAGGWWDHNQHFISHDRLLATIEAYKAEVEGARREMEIFLDACLVESVGDDRSRWPTTPDGEAVARFAKDTRALKTTPTGEEGEM